MIVERDDGRWTAVHYSTRTISRPLSSYLAAKCWMLVRDDRSDGYDWRYNVLIASHETTEKIADLIAD